jgi:hypothetical protein
MVEDFPGSLPINKKPKPGEKRWYDTTFVKKFVESFEEVPPYKRDTIATKINDTIESVFKNEINRKVNTNKSMILGMYKEFEKRRWYDRNPNITKAIKGMCSLVDQRRDLQKLAVAGIIDAFGEYYIKDEPKEVEIRPPEMEAPKPKEQPVPEPEPEEDTKKKGPDSKVMVSGEKLFIKRDKPKLKPKKKINPQE